MCYRCEKESVMQIGYLHQAVILSRRGGRMMPESVSAPSAYGYTSADQYRGGVSWRTSDLFSHVRTPGIYAPRVI